MRDAAPDEITRATVDMLAYPYCVLRSRMVNQQTKVAGCTLATNIPQTPPQQHGIRDCPPYLALDAASSALDRSY
eukprot:667279-Lingulodinium_polyedra.AAC.1